VGRKSNKDIPLRIVRFSNPTHRLQVQHYYHLRSTTHRSFMDSSLPSQLSIHRAPLLSLFSSSSSALLLFFFQSHSLSFHSHPFSRLCSLTPLLPPTLVFHTSLNTLTPLPHPFDALITSVSCASPPIPPPNFQSKPQSLRSTLRSSKHYLCLNLPCRSLIRRIAIS